MTDIIVTLPSKIKWSDYEKELRATELDSNIILNFKVSSLPKKTKKNDKCFIVHKNYIRGYMKIIGFSEKKFKCTTTGKDFIRKFIERQGKFYPVNVLKMRGFQGYRYFDYEKYLNERIEQSNIKTVFKKHIETVSKFLVNNILLELNQEMESKFVALFNKNVLKQIQYDLENNIQLEKIVLIFTKTGIIHDEILVSTIKEFSEHFSIVGLVMNNPIFDEFIIKFSFEKIELLKNNIREILLEIKTSEV